MKLKGASSKKTMGRENIFRILFFYLMITKFTSGNIFVAKEMIKETEKELKLGLDNGKQDMEYDRIDVLRLHSMDTKDTAMHTHHGTSTMHMMSHIDPSLMVFFLIEDLKSGYKIQIYFPKREPLSTSQFLPKQKAESIPFSSNQLPNLLKLFSFSQNSPQAKAMKDTLRQCEARPIKGETKLCVTSHESMLEFTRGIFGFDAELAVLSTTHLTRSDKNTLLQKYTISDLPKEILAPKMVPCHTMPYPYVVLYCHYQVSESKVFKVVLEGEQSGEKVEAVALCHMDTSQWSPKHASFMVLGVKPGSPICHFLPDDNLVWVEMFPTLVS